jgi:hypothetical protein
MNRQACDGRTHSQMRCLLHGPPSGGCCLNIRRRYMEGSRVSIGKRPEANGAAKSASVEIWGDELGMRFPVLMEWLSADKWEDGVPRVLPSFNLFVGDGALKAFLNDRDLGRSACVTGATFGQLLETVERKLSSGDLDWRPAFRGKRK